MDNELYIDQNTWNPILQREIYDLIDEIYFNDFNTSNQNAEASGDGSAVQEIPKDNSNFKEYIDTADFELKKLNIEKLDKIEVKNTIKKLAIQKDIVGRKASDIILQNSKAYSIELQRVSEFKLLLEDSNQICVIARRSLLMSEYMFVLPVLKLVKKQIKKLHLISLLNTIKTIKSFQDSTVEIVSLINSKEFPSAINLCIKTENSMSKYDHLKCIKELKISIKEYYQVIEKNIDDCMLKICRQFDENLYSKSFSAYTLLDKLITFMDLLNQNILSTINTVSSQTLLNIIITKYIAANEDKFFKSNSGTQNNDGLSQTNNYLEELKQKEFNQLYSLIEPEDYKRSLFDLCSNLWQIMKNYYKICIWTYNNYILPSRQNPDTKNMGIEIEKKLLLSIDGIWKDIQLKISSFFKFMSFEHFKFDEFIEIITIINKLIEVGQEFCNKKSDNQIMLNATKEQTLAYFRSYHVLHLEELKMFLENETWQWCPVKSNFSIYKLQEFKFLQKSNGLNGETTNGSSIFECYSYENKENETNDIFDINLRMQELIKMEGNIFKPTNKSQPLSVNQHNDNNNNNSSDLKETDINNEEEISYIEDNDHDHFKNGTCELNTPIFTNTALNVIRLFGKYIHMLSILEIISTEVISYLMQLFYFYFYYIYSNFTQDVDQSVQSLLVIIRNIKNELFIQSKYKISEPVIASIKTPRNRQDYLSCINERIVAAESLIFLSSQLESLFPLIQKHLPVKNNTQNTFESYKKIIKDTPKIRIPIYSHIGKFAIDYSQILDGISRVNWDLSEILSQHNKYIDVLLTQVKQLILDVESLRESFPLEKKIVDSILEQTIKLIMKTLVEGFASVKKCSNEGRALMQLDFQHFVVKLEKTCDIRPLPDKDFVEVYIKAYYLPDSTIEGWIREHPEYSQKQIISLVNIMNQVTRKTRSNIISSYENS